MLNLLGFEEIVEFLPFLFMPLFFVIAFIVIIVAVVKRAKAEQQRRDDVAKQASYPFTDGNGRTEQQRDYLNAKRRELADRKAKAQDASHSHGGKKETYDKIVGSLGEINDEGCYELDGVRLIEHDEAYCDDPEHLMPHDTEDIQKAIVLGEILNTPRFKQTYRRK